VVITSLEKLLEFPDMLGMITTVIIGNSSTFHYKDMMINPRGYRSKYELIKDPSTFSIANNESINCL